MAQKRKKYMLPITPEIDVALKHLAVDRGLTIADTVVLAVAEMAERDGWLVRVDADSTQSEDS